MLAGTVSSILCTSKLVDAYLEFSVLLLELRDILDFLDSAEIISASSNSSISPCLLEGVWVCSLLYLFTTNVPSNEETF